MEKVCKKGERKHCSGFHCSCYLSLQKKKISKETSLQLNLTTGHEESAWIFLETLHFDVLPIVLPISMDRGTMIVAKSQHFKSSNLTQASATQIKNNQNFKLPEHIQKSFPWDIYYHVYHITSILKFPFEVYKSDAQITSSYSLQIFKAYRKLDLYKIL